MGGSGCGGAAGRAGRGVNAFDVLPALVARHSGVIFAVYGVRPLTLALLAVTPALALLVVCCPVWPPLTRRHRRGCIQPDGRRDVHAHLQAPVFLNVICGRPPPPLPTTAAPHVPPPFFRYRRLPGRTLAAFYRLPLPLHCMGPCCETLTIRPMHCAREKNIRVRTQTFGSARTGRCGAGEHLHRYHAAELYILTALPCGHLQRHSC